MKKLMYNMVKDNRFNHVFIDVVGMISSAITTSVVFNFFLSYFIQIGFSYLWGLINTLQLILYLPMLKVSIPKNAKLFYIIMLSLANLELIPTKYSTELVFDISSEQDRPFSRTLEEFGYETHNILLNMGSLFIYLTFFTFGLVLLGILKVMRYFISPH